MKKIRGKVDLEFLALAVSGKIGEMQVQPKSGGEGLGKPNFEFVIPAADQRETQKFQKAELG
eukprot:5730417-Heterocapsa_arctica.AAC.1